MRVKPKTLPPTPGEKEACGTLKKSLFKAVVEKGKAVDRAAVEKAVAEPGSQSVTLTEDRLTEVATRNKGVAPSVPPVQSSYHESTEAHSFTDRFRGLGVALEDFVPRNLPENPASLAEAASKAASKAALATKASKTTAATFTKAVRNIIQEEDSEEDSEEVPP